MILIRKLSDEEILKIARDNWVLDIPEDAITLVRACFEAAQVAPQIFQD